MAAAWHWAGQRGRTTLRSSLSEGTADGQDFWGCEILPPQIFVADYLSHHLHESTNVDCLLTFCFSLCQGLNLGYELDTQCVSAEQRQASCWHYRPQGSLSLFVGGAFCFVLFEDFFSFFGSTAWQVGS